MSNKWGSSRYATSSPKVDKDSDLRVHFFVSRNKDNHGVSGFKSRKRAFVAYDSESEALNTRFENFVREGVEGEFCRHYASVNARDAEKVRRAVIHRLVDGADFIGMDRLVASEAAKPECAKTKKWMFDFDCGDWDKLVEFSGDVHSFGGFSNDSVTFYDTPHGFALVVPRGFDTRELLEKWGSVATLKRDDMLIVDWAQKA